MMGTHMFTFEINLRMGEGGGNTESNHAQQEGPVVHILCTLFQFQFTPNDSSHTYWMRQAGFPFLILLSTFL